ncbi:hypothetical protein M8494_03845 [Serratia ureilytica]
MMSFENALHEQRAKPSAFSADDSPRQHRRVITIDVPGDKVNTLKAGFVEQVNDVLIGRSSIPRWKGLVIVSGKPDSFIAGADITMAIAACTSAQKEAETLARKGQHAGADRRVPGAGSGGHSRRLPGRRLWSRRWPAMAASVRWMTKPALGLPEVQLGLLPSSGAHAAPAALVGAAKALDMILTGKHIRARPRCAWGWWTTPCRSRFCCRPPSSGRAQGWKYQRELPWQDRLLSGPPGRSPPSSIAARKR